MKRAEWAILSLSAACTIGLGFIECRLVVKILSFDYVDLLNPNRSTGRHHEFVKSAAGSSRVCGTSLFTKQKG